MMLSEPEIFVEVADALDITDPAIVEQDFFLIQLLRLLGATDTEGFLVVKENPMVLLILQPIKA